MPNTIGFSESGIEITAGLYAYWMEKLESYISLLQKVKLKNPEEKEIYNDLFSRLNASYKYCKNQERLTVTVPDNLTPLNVLEVEVEAFLKGHPANEATSTAGI